MGDGYWLVRQGSFQRVVSDVRAGRLAPLESGLLSLPREYGLPSSGANQVLVGGRGVTLTVQFLTAYGAVGGFAGYMYASADEPAVGPDFAAERIRSHWYWPQSSEVVRE